MAAGQIGLFVGDRRGALIRLQRLDDAGEASLFLAPRRASLSWRRFLPVPARGHSWRRRFPPACGRPGRRPLGRAYRFQPTLANRSRARWYSASLPGSDVGWTIGGGVDSTSAPLAWSWRNWQSTPGRCRLARRHLLSALACLVLDLCLPFPQFGLVLAKFGLDARKPRGALTQTGHFQTFLRLPRGGGLHHGDFDGSVLDPLGDGGQFFARQFHPVTIVFRLVGPPGRSLDATVGLAGDRPPGRLGFPRPVLRLFVGGVESGAQVRADLLDLGGAAAPWRAGAQ